MRALFGSLPPMKTRADHSTYSARAEGKSQHGRIVSELGLAIVGGELQPGDKLPPEAQLLERYEISRPVLREAVRVLVAKGLVVSRQRAGAIVRPRNEWHLLDPDVLYWLIQAQPQRDFVQTLLEVRQIFEPAAAALAARAATDEQLGKPAGHDLVEGVYTLPVILTLAHGGAPADELRDLLGKPVEGPELDKALAIVRSNGAVHEAVEIARGYAHRAAAAAAPLRDTPATQALAQAGHALLDSLLL